MKISKRWMGLMVLLFSAGLWAAEAVQPLEGRHGGKAGDTQTGSFLITNVLSKEVDVAMSPADYPSAGDAIPLSKTNGLVLEGPANFRLKVGENRSVHYRVIFPTPLDKPAAGAISLVIRTAGDSMSTPLINRLMPIFLQPQEKTSSLKIDLEQPTVRFSAATGEVQGPKMIEVSLLVRNIGADTVRPRGRVEFRKGSQSLEALPLQGSDVINSGGTAIFSTRTHRTDWTSGAYDAHVTFDYGDYYGQPQKLEKTYFFRVDGEMISIQPGSATPTKVAPR